MNSRNEAKLNMFRTVKQVCDTNIAIITPNPALQAAYNIYKAKLSGLISTVSAESKVISGITIDKSERRKNLCQATTDLIALVYAYASAQNDNTLKQAMNFSISDLMRLKDDLLPPTCQNIYNTISSISLQLADYGINDNLLDAYESAIVEYSDAVPKPRTAKTLKAVYGLNIRNTVKELDTLLKEQMDRMVVSLKNSHPDFFNVYQQARIIVDPGSTVTQLKGSIKDAETQLPIIGASVTIDGAGHYDVKTNNLGNYLIKPLPHGNYSIQIVANGYEPMNINTLPVKLGQINKHIVTMTQS